MNASDLKNYDFQQKIEELHNVLEFPDIDDAEYILKQVYETLELDIPSFLDK